MSSAHWDAAYDNGDTTRSWYQESADVSLDLLSGIDRAAALIDIGGGASTLVDGLLAAGWQDLTVVDVSATGMRIAQERLGDAASEVTWIQGDLLSWRPDRTYDVWHDRAVLHFLTEPSDRQRYREQLLAATAPGATIVIGVFGPEGPESCSGLPTHRFDVAGLTRLLGPEVSIEDAFLAGHRTPAGGAQQFQWVLGRRGA